MTTVLPHRGSPALGEGRDGNQYFDSPNCPLKFSRKERAAPWLERNLGESLPSAICQSAWREEEEVCGFGHLWSFFLIVLEGGSETSTRISPSMNDGLAGSWSGARSSRLGRLSGLKPGWGLRRQVQAELRLRGGFRQPRGAHVQNTSEFSRATQTKAIKAGLATPSPHSEPCAAANSIRPRAAQEPNFSRTWTTLFPASPPTGRDRKGAEDESGSDSYSLSASGKIRNFRALFFFSVKQE